MTTIILTIFILIEVIYYLIIFHIILSWISLLGIVIRIKFIDDILWPLYKYVRKIFPTRIGMFDFTPIILLFTLYFIKWLIIMLFPDIAQKAINILF